MPRSDEAPVKMRTGLIGGPSRSPPGKEKRYRSYRHIQPIAPAKARRYLLPSAGALRPCVDLFHHRRRCRMASASLVLHRGARQVTPDELALVPCPAPEGRWRPVPHGTVLSYATQALQDAGYEIEKLDLGLSRDDHRFYGAVTLKTPLVAGDRKS